eukprot:m.138783 g.138783  ORF g.138783 m.138783 type:complete len:79 (+) comp30014_c0_seq2:113-349(+)
MNEQQQQKIIVVLSYHHHQQLTIVITTREHVKTAITHIFNTDSREMKLRSYCPALQQRYTLQWAWMSSSLLLKQSLRE